MLLNVNDRHRILSQMVTDEASISFYDISTRQESRIEIHLDTTTPKMAKSKELSRKLCTQFSSELVKSIKLHNQWKITANW